MDQGRIFLIRLFPLKLFLNLYTKMFLMNEVEVKINDILNNIINKDDSDIEDEFIDKIRNLCNDSESDSDN